MSKEGSTIGGLMDTVATLTSMALQYGVPLESLVKKFAYQRFEPSGLTNDADIRAAKSIVDYIFRWLGTQCSAECRAEHAGTRNLQIEESAVTAEDDSATGETIRTKEIATRTPVD